MCLECFQEPLEPPTPKTRNLRDKLKLIFWIQLVIALLKIFLGFLSVMGGFNGFVEIIACFLLYVAYSQLEFTNCMYYVFICIYLSLLDICIVGGLLQQGKNPIPSNESALYKIFMTLVIISFFFYLVAGYYSFQSYKEFKAVAIEMGGFAPASTYQRMGRDYDDDDDEEYQRQRPVQAPQSNNNNTFNNSSANSNPQIPSSSTVNQNRPIPPANQANQTNQANRNQQQPGFQAFSGQGLRIGGH